MDEKIICCKCNQEMVLQKTNFTYMGFQFSTDLPSCPVCGLVFIAEEVVQKKMTTMELQLEEK
jgi:hypothetical protein